MNLYPSTPAQPSPPQVEEKKNFFFFYFEISYLETVTGLIFFHLISQITFLCKSLFIG